MPDENVIDARARFTPALANASALATSDRSVEHHAESLLQTRARLEEADRVAEEVSAIPRIPQADRPRMARNLGRMVEGAGAESVHANVAALFQKCFGCEPAESALKKRKRYVRFSLEPLPSAVKAGEYNAHGVFFVRLAHAWADLTASGRVASEDGRRQAVLNLVEGTSFDTRARSVLRRTEIGRREFVERMGDVLARVEAAVDLERYLDDACELPLNATRVFAEIDDTRDVRDNTRWRDLRLKTLDEIERLGQPVTGPIGEDSDDIDGVHFLAPSILIGVLYTPVRVGDAVPYRLSPRRHSPDHDPIVAALIERFGTENALIYEAAVTQYRSELVTIAEVEPKFTDEYAAYRKAQDECDVRFRERLQAELSLPVRPPRILDPYLERVRNALASAHGPEAVRIIDDQVGDAKGGWEATWNVLSDDNQRFLWGGKPMFLSIYRERATGRARLAITVEDGMFVHHTSVIQHGAPDVFGSSQQPQGINHSDVYYVITNLNSGYLVRDIYATALGVLGEYENQLLLLPGNGALKLAFAPMDRKPQRTPRMVFRPLFNDCRSDLSPAPSDTIAGAILRNLAHASPGERLDELLIKDAHAKNEEMRACIEREERRYHEGMKRLKGQGEPVG